MKHTCRKETQRAIKMSLRAEGVAILSFEIASSLTLLAMTE
ncbi:MAG: hypothetical protein Q8K51_02930 [Nitrospirota bacterium]|nr:hypothetical protein [Nitrospirota bacterium]